MDSTLLLGTMWTIFILCLNFVFYAMTHLYRRYASALGGSDIDITFTKPKHPPVTHLATPLSPSPKYYMLVNLNYKYI